MAETSMDTPAAAPVTGGGRSVVGAMAWRNLWRNRRRTWLTSAGIAFAVWMLVFAQSLQEGTFATMIDNGARLALGHVQLQHPGYLDDPRMEYSIDADPQLLEAIRSSSGVVNASARAQGFALVSHGERSFGAQVLGVDAVVEARWSTLPGMVSAGRYLAGPGEALLGSVLARNLGLAVGDEVVMLGTAREGGVAATVAEVVGLFTSGQAELDRSLLQIDISDFRTGWSLGPTEAHSVVVLANSVAVSEEVAADLLRLRQVRGSESDWAVLGWRTLMPEAEQYIELKRVGTRLMFAVITIIVTFSVVNTFMMTVFERTPEFGMLTAIGMRPGKIMLQLAAESFWMAALGLALGFGFSLLCIVPLMIYGMPLPGAADEILREFNMPDRLYPTFSMNAAVTAALIMLIGTQFAALIPMLKIRRLRPVEALRARA
ncbi:MAG: ABC transporter permease [Pseudomonadales bacterium]|nr:ABC transporter permease [Pseudomonadales bacterium]